jgi:hypothetical protein
MTKMKLNRIFRHGILFQICAHFLVRGIHSIESKENEKEFIVTPEGIEFTKSNQVDWLSLQTLLAISFQSNPKYF